MIAKYMIQATGSDGKKGMVSPVYLKFASRDQAEQVRVRYSNGDIALKFGTTYETVAVDSLGYVVKE